MRSNTTSFWMAAVVATTCLISAQIYAPIHLKPLSSQLLNYPRSIPTIIYDNPNQLPRIIQKPSSELSVPFAELIEKIVSIPQISIVRVNTLPQAEGGEVVNRPTVTKPVKKVKDIQEEVYEEQNGTEQFRYGYQVAATQTYVSQANGQTCNDGGGTISGTYCAPNGERYNVNLEATNQAAAEFNKGVIDKINELTPEEIVNLAGNTTPTPAGTCQDPACQQQALEAALQTVTSAALVGEKKTDVQNATESYLANQKAQDYINLSAEALKEKYGTSDAATLLPTVSASVLKDIEAERQRQQAIISSAKTVTTESEVNGKTVYTMTTTYTDPDTGKVIDTQTLSYTAETSSTKEKVDNGFITHDTVIFRDTKTGDIIDAQTTSYILKSTTKTYKTAGRASGGTVENTSVTTTTATDANTGEVIQTTRTYAETTKNSPTITLIQNTTTPSTNGSGNATTSITRSTIANPNYVAPIPPASAPLNTFNKKLGETCTSNTDCSTGLCGRASVVVKDTTCQANPNQNSPITASPESCPANTSLSCRGTACACLTQSQITNLETLERASSGNLPALAATIPQDYSYKNDTNAIGNYAGANGNLALNKLLTYADTGWSVIPSWDRYKNSFSPDNAKRQWQAMNYSSLEDCQKNLPTTFQNGTINGPFLCNDVIYSQEQFISSVDLGTDLTSIGAAVTGIPGALKAGGNILLNASLNSAVTGVKYTLGQSSMTALQAALPTIGTFGAISTANQTGDTAVSCLDGSETCTRDLGYTTLSWLNLGSMQYISNAMASGVASQIRNAQIVNTTLTVANAGTDVAIANESCFGENKTTAGCLASAGVIAFDIAGGFFDLKTGQFIFQKVPDLNVNSAALASLANNPVPPPTKNALDPIIETTIKAAVPDVPNITVLKNGDVNNPLIIRDVQIDGINTARLDTSTITDPTLRSRAELTNALLDEFAKDIGYQPYPAQVAELLSGKTVMQLKYPDGHALAGQPIAGKTDIIARLASVGESKSVVLTKGTTEAMDYINTQMLGPGGRSFYQSQGATGIFVHNELGFLEIDFTKGSFNPNTARVMSADEVSTLLKNNLDLPDESRLVFVADRPQAAWTRLSDNSSGLVMKDLLTTNTYGSALIIADEISEDIKGVFAVSGAGIPLGDLTDASLLGGVKSGDQAINIFKQAVDESPTHQQFASARSVELNSGTGVAGSLQNLGDGNFIPVDKTVYGNTLADIVDQSLKKYSHRISKLGKELTDLLPALRSGDPAAIKNFEALLADAPPSSLLTDITFRKSSIQSDYNMLARVPGSDFGIEGNDLVLRKATATTGEKLSGPTDLLAFYHRGYDMTQAYNAHMIEKIDINKPITRVELADISISPQGSKISVTEFYQEMQTAGHKLMGLDATPQEAISALYLKDAPIETKITPAHLATDTNRSGLVDQFVDRRASQFNNNASAVVLAKTNSDMNADLLALVKKSHEKGVGYTEVIVAQYKKQPNGLDETEEYIAYTVKENGEIDFENRRNLGDAQGWNAAIQSKLSGDKPQELLIVYMGRERAADLKITANHDKIRWSLLFETSGGELPTEVSFEQMWRRNRIFNDVNNNGFAKSMDFDLYLTTTRTDLTPENIQTAYFRENLNTKLANDRFTATLDEIAKSPVRALDQIKALGKEKMSNLARVRFNRLVKQLEQEVVTFENILRTGLSPDLLKADDLYLELHARASRSNARILDMVEQVGKVLGNTDLSALKRQLHAVDTFPEYGVFRAELDNPTLEFNAPESYGPADLLMAYAKNNSTSVDAAPQFRATNERYIAPTTPTSATTPRSAPTNPDSSGPIDLNNYLAQALASNRNNFVAIPTLNGQPINNLIYQPSFSTLAFLLRNDTSVSITRAEDGSLYYLELVGDQTSIIALKDFNEVIKRLPNPASIVNIQLNEQDLARESLNLNPTPTNSLSIATNKVVMEVIEDIEGKDELPNTASTISRIPLARGQLITSRSDIKSFVETPLVNAVETLWDKNIQTGDSNAYVDPEIGSGRAWIGIERDSLSEENLKIALSIQGVGNDNPKRIFFYYPITKDTPPQEISDWAMSIANELRPQPFIWSDAIIDIEQLRNTYSLSPEAVEENIEIAGWHKHTDGRVFASKEIADKYLETEKRSAKNSTSQPLMLTAGTRIAGLLLASNPTKPTPSTDTKTLIQPTQSLSQRLMASTLKTVLSVLDVPQDLPITQPAMLALPAPKAPFGLLTTTPPRKLLTQSRPLALLPAPAKPFGLLTVSLNFVPTADELVLIDQALTNLVKLTDEQNRTARQVRQAEVKAVIDSVNTIITDPKLLLPAQASGELSGKALAEIDSAITQARQEANERIAKLEAENQAVKADLAAQQAARDNELSVSRLVNSILNPVEGWEAIGNNQAVRDAISEALIRLQAIGFSVRTASNGIPTTPSSFVLALHSESTQASLAQINNQTDLQSIVITLTYLNNLFNQSVLSIEEARSIELEVQKLALQSQTLAVETQSLAAQAQKEAHELLMQERELANRLDLEESRQKHEQALQAQQRAHELTMQANEHAHQLQINNRSNNLNNSITANVSASISYDFQTADKLNQALDNLVEELAVYGTPSYTAFVNTPNNVEAQNQAIISALTKASLTEESMNSQAILGLSYKKIVALINFEVTNSLVNEIKAEAQAQALAEQNRETAKRLEEALVPNTTPLLTDNSTAKTVQEIADAQAEVARKAAEEVERVRKEAAARQAEIERVQLEATRLSVANVVNSVLNPLENLDLLKGNKEAKAAISKSLTQLKGLGLEVKTENGGTPRTASTFVEALNSLQTKESLASITDQANLDNIVTALNSLSQVFKGSILSVQEAQRLELEAQRLVLINTLKKQAEARKILTIKNIPNDAKKLAVFISRVEELGFQVVSYKSNINGKDKEILIVEETGIPQLPNSEYEKILTAEPTIRESLKGQYFENCDTAAACAIELGIAEDSLISNMISDIIGRQHYIAQKQYLDSSVYSLDYSFGTYLNIGDGVPLVVHAQNKSKLISILDQTYSGEWRNYNNSTRAAALALGIDLTKSPLPQFKTFREYDEWVANRAIWSINKYDKINSALYLTGEYTRPVTINNVPITTIESVKQYPNDIYLLMMKDGSQGIYHITGLEAKLVLKTDWQNSVGVIETTRWITSDKASDEPEFDTLWQDSVIVDTLTQRIIPIHQITGFDSSKIETITIKEISPNSKYLVFKQVDTNGYRIGIVDLALPSLVVNYIDSGANNITITSITDEVLITESKSLTKEFILKELSLQKIQPTLKDDQPNTSIINLTRDATISLANKLGIPNLGEQSRILVKDLPVGEDRVAPLSLAPRVTPLSITLAGLTQNQIESVAARLDITLPTQFATGITKDVAAILESRLSNLTPATQLSDTAINIHKEIDKEDLKLYAEYFKLSDISRLLSSNADSKTTIEIVFKAKSNTPEAMIIHNPETTLTTIIPSDLIQPDSISSIVAYLKEAYPSGFLLKKNTVVLNNSDQLLSQGLYTPLTLPYFAWTSPALQNTYETAFSNTLDNTNLDKLRKRSQAIADTIVSGLNTYGLDLYLHEEDLYDILIEQVVKELSSTGVLKTINSTRATILIRSYLQPTVVETTTRFRDFYRNDQYNIELLVLNELENGNYHDWNKLLSKLRADTKESTGEFNGIGSDSVYSEANRLYFEKLLTEDNIRGIWDRYASDFVSHYNTLNDTQKRIYTLLSELNLKQRIISNYETVDLVKEELRVISKKRLDTQSRALVDELLILSNDFNDNTLKTLSLLTYINIGLSEQYGIANERSDVADPHGDPIIGEESRANNTDTSATRETSTLRTIFSRISRAVIMVAQSILILLTFQQAVPAADITAPNTYESGYYQTYTPPSTGLATESNSTTSQLDALTALGVDPLTQQAIVDHLIEKDPSLSSDGLLLSSKVLDKYQEIARQIGYDNMYSPYVKLILKGAVVQEVKDENGDVIGKVITYPKGEINGAFSFNKIFPSSEERIYDNTIMPIATINNITSRQIPVIPQTAATCWMHTYTGAVSYLQTMNESTPLLIDPFLYSELVNSENFNDSYINEHTSDEGNKDDFLDTYKDPELAAIALRDNSINRYLDTETEELNTIAGELGYNILDLSDAKRVFASERWNMPTTLEYFSSTSEISFNANDEEFLNILKSLNIATEDNFTISTIKGGERGAAVEGDAGNYQLIKVTLNKTQKALFMSYALQQLGFNPVGESLIVNLEPVTGDAALMHSLFVVGIEDGLVRLADGRINNKKSNPSNWNEWPGIKFDEATQTYTMPLDTLLDGLYSVQSVTYQNPGTLASELELSDYQATIQKMIEQSTLPSNQTEVDGLSTTLDSEANVTNIDFRTIVYESEINQELTRKLNDLGLERQVVFSEIVNDYIELQATPEGQAIIQNEYMPYLDSGKQYQADFFPVNNDDERSHAVGAFTHYITARMAQEKDVNGNRLFPDEMIESDQFKAGVDVITQQLGIYKKDISFKQFIQCVANVYMSIVLDPVDDQLNLPQLPLEDANQVFSIMNEYGLSREGGKGFMDAWEDGDEIHGQYVYSSNNGSWAAWNVDTAAEFKNGDLVFFGLNHVIRIQRVYNTENGVVIAYTQANDPRVLYDSTEISTTKGVPEVTLVSERSFLDFVGPLEDVLILRSEISSNVPNSISTPTPIIEFVSNTSTTP